MLRVISIQVILQPVLSTFELHHILVFIFLFSPMFIEYFVSKRRSVVDEMPDTVSSLREPSSSDILGNN